MDERSSHHDERSSHHGDTVTLPPPPYEREAAPPAGTRPRGVLRAVLASALVAALVAAAVAVATTLALVDGAAPATEEAADAPAPVADVPGAPGELASVADVAEVVLPSVARIDVGTRGSGSAVAYREDGYLLTNEHVVRDAGELEVTLPDGTRARATVVGADRVTDIAVVRIVEQDLPAGGLPVPAFSDDVPRVGETAIAIGSPFGLDASVTAGIVSAVGRSVPGTPLTDVIQTDAPINPGNSGGGLVNDRAEIIGINTAILGSGPGAGGNIGIGFAIPVHTARAIGDQLVEHGSVQHAQLGIQGQDVDRTVAELYGLSVREGALVVAVVPGSPADEAGLERGDIIAALDGEAVSSMLELSGRIRALQPGDAVTLTIIRAGQEQTVEATLGAAG